MTAALELPSYTGLEQRETPERGAATPDALEGQPLLNKGMNLMMTVTPTPDTSNTGDISEKSAAIPDLDGRDVVVETFMYPAFDEGAFVAVQNATTLANGESAWTESTTIRGAQAVQLGLHLIAAGRRALELEAAR